MMIAELRTYLVFFLIFVSINSFANEYCKLFNSNDLPQISHQTHTFSFQEKTLICSPNIGFKTNHQDSQPIDDYYVIRSHRDEVSSMNVLASSHGYHLISEKFVCHTGHCQHVNILPLKDFNSIKSIKKKTLSLQKNSLIQAMTDQIDTDLWKLDIVTLSSWSRVSTTTDNDSARVWIANKMIDLGLQTSTPEFTVFGNTTRNIIGVQTGTTRADDWYVVGAHMDSIPSNGPAPGAVDNASGCAGVLEMARIASQYTFEATILFICYSGEEQGLRGSQFHVSTLINEGNQSKIKAALTMDMIGYTSNSTLHEILIESSSANQWLIDVLVLNANSYAPNLDVFTSTNPFGSDHVPYINNNMHGILSIDNDWDEYDDYHQSTDLPENLNLTQGEYILKTNMASLAQLATVVDSENYIFTNGFE